MSYYKTTFWERWLTGFILMLPITLITACPVGFIMMDQPWQGLGLMVGEAAFFGFFLGICPTAEVFRKPWWDDSED